MKKAHETENFFRVRQRPRSQFKAYRIPAWSANVANSVSKGSKIVMGQTKKGEWKIQSIIIQKHKGVGKSRAVTLAKKIRNKLEKKKTKKR